MSVTIDDAANGLSEPGAWVEAMPSLPAVAGKAVDPRAASNSSAALVQFGVTTERLDVVAFLRRRKANAEAVLGVPDIGADQVADARGRIAELDHLIYGFSNGCHAGASA